MSECSSGGFQKFLSDIKSKAKVNDDLSDMAELDNYLKENLLPEEVELDLLLWWKTNGGKYPTLQRIAKDVLAIPVSTVASESAFSTSGRLISPHRSRLHPQTLEALMCAQSWLLNEIRGNTILYITLLLMLFIFMNNMFMLLVLNIETCSEETEAYCRTIEYDMDVEEVIIFIKVTIFVT